MKSRRTRRLKRRVSRKRRTRRTTRRRTTRRTTRRRTRRTRRRTRRIIRRTRRIIRRTRRRRGGAKPRVQHRPGGLPPPGLRRSPPPPRSPPPARSPPLTRTSSNPIEIPRPPSNIEARPLTLMERSLLYPKGKIKELPKTPPKYAPPPPACVEKRVLSGYTEPTILSALETEGVECAVNLGSDKLLPNSRDTLEELMKKKTALEKYRDEYIKRNDERRNLQEEEEEVRVGFSGREDVMALVKMCREALLSGPPSEAVDTCKKAVKQMPPLKKDARGRPILVIDGKSSIEPESLTMLRANLYELLAEARDAGR
jgi:hypothetical protein